LPAGEAEAIAYAVARDVVVVVGVGNLAQLSVDNAYALLPGVVVVSGLTRSGAFWSGSAAGDHVALAAPAVDIVNVGARNVHNTGYSTGDGTSESAAIVSGVAALVRAEFPDLDAANVINRLIRTAVDEGDPGRDRRYGFGVLDARRALTADVPRAADNPLGEPAAATDDPRPGRSNEPIVGIDDPPSLTPVQLLVTLALVGIVGLAVLILVIWLVARSRRPRPTVAPPSPVEPPPAYPSGVYRPAVPPAYPPPPPTAPPIGRPPPGPPPFGPPPSRP
jgi:subtilisin family serine protease